MLFSIKSPLISDGCMADLDNWYHFSCTSCHRECKIMVVFTVTTVPSYSQLPILPLKEAEGND